MIITLEGAPAVGKTTLAKYLQKHHGYYRVPEVNELSPSRPKQEPEYWYCEQQLVRCALAADNQPSVLDGDPLQPVWFSWFYPERGYLPWDQALRFFMENTQSLRIPSIVGYLRVDDGARFEREQGREHARGHTRAQFLAKWARYADFPLLQTVFFAAMSQRFPSWVQTLDNVDTAAVADVLLSAKVPRPPSAENYLTWLRDWLSSNDPNSCRTPA